AWGKLLGSTIYNWYGAAIFFFLYLISAFSGHTPGEQVKTGDLLPRTPSLRADIRDKVTVGTAANNTPGNALETAAWARTMNVHSIRLVTAAYHMRRSLLEFHAAMPGIAIVPHAVFPRNVKSDWWRWPGTASLFAREYTKFLATWAMQRLGIATATEAGSTKTTTAKTGEPAP
ncbi:MAG: YdcF family protein, partial [Rhodospirillaceae bacterium]|nr:YdcF family protein [Rhodospirillaceae bacterium]